MLRSRIGGRIVAGVVSTMLLAALAPVAFGATPKVVGNPKAGKSSYSTTCAACHTLKAAASTGTIGPNLDTAAKTLTEAQIIKAITNGGASIMTAAQKAKYTTQMVAYKGTLSTTVINNIAAFIYTSTHKM